LPGRKPWQPFLVNLLRGAGCLFGLNILSIQAHGKCAETNEQKPHQDQACP
jgi:hypothetical protein